MTAFRLRYGAEDVDLQQREQSFRGYFSLETLTLRHRLFEGGWSAPMRRELFQRGDAVGVLPWDPVKDELVLIEQFRVGALRDGHSPWMLELVAGIVEAGESDSEVVHREAEEEAGCRLGRLEPIATFYPSAGACSEQIRLFVGEVTQSQPGTVQGLESEHEDILVHQLPRESGDADAGSQRDQQRPHAHRVAVVGAPCRSASRAVALRRRLIAR